MLMFFIARGNNFRPVRTAGHAEHPMQTRPMPEGRRTRVASMPQPFPTAVFTASSEQSAFRSLPHQCENSLIAHL